MGNLNGSGQPGPPAGKRHRIFALVLAAVVLGALFLVYYRSPVDPRCRDVLAHPDADVLIPLPVNCRLSADAPLDARVERFEAERKRRGLIFNAWIICAPSAGAESIEFAYTRDPHWLPSYVPGTYQFRRTVIISPTGIPSPHKPVVAAEVCLMPRSRYLSLIWGQCEGKFAVWK